MEKQKRKGDDMGGSDEEKDREGGSYTVTKPVVITEDHLKYELREKKGAKEENDTKEQKRGGI